MNVYVARDNGDDRWIGAFLTLEAAQKAVESWVREYGVRVDGLPRRIKRKEIQGWEKTWDLVPVNVYRLRVTDLQTNVEVAEFNVDQPS